MNAWLKELETLLKKKLYQDEVEEIISFYQEMIEERLEKGESIDHILASYDMKKIVKDVTLDSVLKGIWVHIKIYQRALNRFYSC